MSIIRIENIYG